MISALFTLKKRKGLSFSFNVENNGSFITAYSSRSLTMYIMLTMFISLSEFVQKSEVSMQLFCDTSQAYPAIVNIATQTPSGYRVKQ